VDLRAGLNAVAKRRNSYPVGNRTPVVQLSYSDFSEDRGTYEFLKMRLVQCDVL